MKVAYTEWKPRAESTMSMLADSVAIIEDYAAQGYRLTLRQLYYQLVARDLLPNSQRDYKRLGDLIVKARMAGYIDWESIVDRGRVPVVPAEWDSPRSILVSAAESYRLDRWSGQAWYVEVWCEKDALSSVLEPVCDRYHIRFLANRGYSSASAMFDASRRFADAGKSGKKVALIYLGDHDPSGMDMTRDIMDRQREFLRGSGLAEMTIHRLALNLNQVQTYNPPPNPAKLSDSRARSYIAQYGYESWELDALEPQTLDQLTSSAILQYLDQPLYDERLRVEELHKDAIMSIADSTDWN